MSVRGPLRHSDFYEISHVGPIYGVGVHLQYFLEKFITSVFLILNTSIALLKI